MGTGCAANIYPGVVPRVIAVATCLDALGPPLVTIRMCFFARTVGLVTGAPSDQIFTHTCFATYSCSSTALVARVQVCCPPPAVEHGAVNLSATAVRTQHVAVELRRACRRGRTAGGWAIKKTFPLPFLLPRVHVLYPHGQPRLTDVRRNICPGVVPRVIAVATRLDALGPPPVMLLAGPACFAAYASMPAMLTMAFTLMKKSRASLSPSCAVLTQSLWLGARTVGLVDGAVFDQIFTLAALPLAEPAALPAAEPAALLPATTAKSIFHFRGESLCPPSEAAASSFAA